MDRKDTDKQDRGSEGSRPISDEDAGKAIGGTRPSPLHGWQPEGERPAGGPR